MQHLNYCNNSSSAFSFSCIRTGEATIERAASDRGDGDERHQSPPGIKAWRSRRRFRVDWLSGKYKVKEWKLAKLKTKWDFISRELINYSVAFSALHRPRAHEINCTAISYRQIYIQPTRRKRRMDLLALSSLVPVLLSPHSAGYN